MAVLNLRSYKIQKAVEESASYVDEETGDIIACTEKVWSEGYDCDIVQSEGNATITNYIDGSQSSYSFVIYMDKKAPDFELGDFIRVVKDGMIIIQTDVKGFRRYQLQCKLWA